MTDPNYEFHPSVGLKVCWVFRGVKIEAMFLDIQEISTKKVVNSGGAKLPQVSSITNFHGYVEVGEMKKEKTHPDGNFVA